MKANRTHFIVAQKTKWNRQNLVLNFRNKKRVDLRKVWEKMNQNTFFDIFSFSLLTEITARPGFLFFLLAPKIFNTTMPFLPKFKFCSPKQQWFQTNLKARCHLKKRSTVKPFGMKKGNRAKEKTRKKLQPKTKSLAHKTKGHYKGYYS